MRYYLEQGDGVTILRRRERKQKALQGFNFWTCPTSARSLNNTSLSSLVLLNILVVAIDTTFELLMFTLVVHWEFIPFCKKIISTYIFWLHFKEIKIILYRLIHVRQLHDIKYLCYGVFPQLIYVLYFRVTSIRIIVSLAVEKEKKKNAAGRLPLHSAYFPHLLQSSHTYCPLL